MAIVEAPLFEAENADNLGIRIANLLDNMRGAFMCECYVQA